jgi:hypothetical protein
LALEAALAAAIEAVGDVAAVLDIDFALVGTVQGQSTLIATMTYIPQPTIGEIVDTSWESLTVERSWQSVTVKRKTVSISLKTKIENA